MLLSEPIVKTYASIDFNPDRIRLSHALAEDIYILLARISCQWSEGLDFDMIGCSPTQKFLLFKSPDRRNYGKVRSWISQHLSQLWKLGGLVS